MTRSVVLLCGPPGAGKTTLATTTYHDHMHYDIDTWPGSEKAYALAVDRLRTDPYARAVVIRSGARRATRARWATRIGATLVLVLPVDPDTCRARILLRMRDRPPLPQQLASVDTWWTRYEPDLTTGPASRAW